MPRSVRAIERSKGVGDVDEDFGPARRGQATPELWKVRLDALELNT
jgi:hypothetical protein